MTARLIPFLRRRVVVTDWTQAELAEFYRVEASLIAAGMRVEADRGLTDEGEPWFVFCHADGEQDVIIHFARLGGSYLVSTPSLGPDLGRSETGDDFRGLVRRLLAQYDAIAAQRQAGDTTRGKGNVVLHPAAMLWVLVALAFLKSAEARAFDGGPAHTAPPGSPVPGSPGTAPSGEDTPALQAMRGADGADPVTMLAGYALQSVMIAWASTLGPLVAETHVAHRMDALETWLGQEKAHDPFTTGATAATATPPSEDSSHTAVYTVASGPAGAGSVAEVAGGPAPAAWHAPDPAASHAVLDPAPDLAIQAMAGTHALPEPLPPQAGIDLPATPVAPEAQQVLDAAGAGDMLKDTGMLPALPSAIASVLDHAVHLSGAPADTAAEQAALQIEMALTSTPAPVASDAPTAGPQDDATAGQTTAGHDATPAAAGATPATTSADSHATAATGMDASGHATDAATAATATTATADTTTTGTSTTGTSATGTSTTGTTTSGDAAHASATDNVQATAAPAAATAPAAEPPPAVTHPASADAAAPAPMATTANPLAPVVLSAASQQQELALATSAVQEFLANVPHAQFMYVQSTLVVYDAAVTNVAQEQAITFDFSDGSHISLVGLPSELAHALAGHA